MPKKVSTAIVKCSVLVFLILGFSIRGAINSFAFSPDGKKICIVVSQTYCKLYLIDIEKKKKKEIELPKKIFGKTIYGVSWNPQRDKIGFIYDIEKIGIYDIKSRKFTFFPKHFAFPFSSPVIRWNKKGEKLLINCSTTYNTERILNCIVFDIDENSVEIEKVYTIDCKVSQTGWGWIEDKVIYTKPEENRIYISDITGREKKLLVEIKGIHYITISPDGDKILAASFEDEVYILEGIKKWIESGIKIKKREVLEYGRYWFPDSKGILICQRKKGVCSFFIYNFDINKKKKIFSRKFDKRIFYKLSPDGEKILIVEYIKEKAYIYEIKSKKLYEIF